MFDSLALCYQRRDANGPSGLRVSALAAIIGIYLAGWLVFDAGTAFRAFEDAVGTAYIIAAPGFIATSALKPGGVAGYLLVE
ncbi:hypothetical protein D3C86_2042850 [compost metagenome]